MNSVTVAANAVPGQGGQGQNLSMIAGALDGPFEVGVIGRNQVPPSRAARLVARVPLLRRRRDVITALDDGHFDRAVAKRLTPCDIFHGATGQCLLAMRRARALGARVVLDSVTLHIAAFGAALDDSCRAFGVTPPIGPAHRERIRLEYGEADLIRVMSDVARRSFEEHGASAEKLVVVPPWIVAPAEAPPPNDGPFRVGFVGLLEPWKGFHYLVEAFEKLDLAGAELVLNGGPGSRPVSNYLQAKVARRPSIIVRHTNPQANLAAAYGPLSVLVHPSLADGFGLVVAEAMACGVPAIVSTAAGAADLIDDGTNGFLVPPGDRDAIADRLALLAGDPGRRQAMGRAARERVLTLTKDAFASRYVPAIRALL